MQLVASTLNRGLSKFIGILKNMIQRLYHHKLILLIVSLHISNIINRYPQEHSLVQIIEATGNFVKPRVILCA